MRNLRLYLLLVLVALFAALPYLSSDGIRENATEITLRSDYGHTLGIQYQGFNCIAKDMDQLYKVGPEDLASELRLLDPSEKVLRYPDGQESINNRRKYDPQNVQSFIDFCKLAGVEQVVYRASFYDVSGSLAAYDQLSGSLDVLYVEMSNEPYLGSNLKVEGLWEFLASIFNKNEYHRLRAIRYANQARSLANNFKAEYPLIWSKLAFASPVPQDDLHKYKIWYNELESRLSDFKNISLHIYGDPGDAPRYAKDWRAEVLAGLDQIDPKFNRICTEYAPFHYGANGNTRFSELAFTDFHKWEQAETIRFLEQNDFTLIMLHTLISYSEARYFGRYLLHFGTGEVQEDRLKDWY